MERCGIILGCWDLFHYGHLKAIQQAIKMCDKLEVGVYSTECVANYKGIAPTLTTEQRLMIVESIKGVSNAFVLYERPVKWLDTYDIIFLGDQWINTDRNNLPMIPKTFYGQIIFIPYTKEISSTKIKEWIKNES